ncbi:HAD family hydrolase, partial [candidate division FCPU426 bacterium]|nr:HAD family hydrolase [candidate division FCPU426 bacterium]
MPWLRAMFVRLGMKGGTYDRWVAWFAENVLSLAAGLLVSVALIATGTVSPEMFWKAGFLAAWPIFFILHFAQMAWKGRAPPARIWIPALLIAGVNAALLLTPLSLPIIFAASFIIHWYVNQVVSRTKVSFREYLRGVLVSPWKEFTPYNLLHPIQFLMDHPGYKPGGRPDYMQLIPRLVGLVAMYASMLAMPVLVLAYVSGMDVSPVMTGLTSLGMSFVAVLMPLVAGILGFAGMHTAYNALTPWAQLSGDQDNSLWQKFMTHHLPIRLVSAARDQRLAYLRTVTDPVTGQTLWQQIQNTGQVNDNTIVHATGLPHIPVYAQFAKHLLTDPELEGAYLVMIGRSMDLVYDAAEAWTQVQPELSGRRRSLRLVDFNRRQFKYWSREKQRAYLAKALKLEIAPQTRIVLVDDISSEEYNAPSTLGELTGLLTELGLPAGQVQIRLLQHGIADQPLANSQAWMNIRAQAGATPEEKTALAEALSWIANIYEAGREWVVEEKKDEASCLFGSDYHPRRLANKMMMAAEVARQNDLELSGQTVAVGPTRQETEALPAEESGKPSSLLYQWGASSLRGLMLDSQHKLMQILIETLHLEETAARDPKIQAWRRVTMELEGRVLQGQLWEIEKKTYIQLGNRWLELSETRLATLPVEKWFETDLLKGNPELCEFLGIPVPALNAEMQSLPRDARLVAVLPDILQAAVEAMAAPAEKPALTTDRKVLESIWAENQKGRHPHGINLLAYPQKYGAYAVYYLIRDIKQHYPLGKNISPKTFPRRIGEVAGNKNYQAHGVTAERFFVLKDMLQQLLDTNRLADYSGLGHLHDFVDLFRSRLEAAEIDPGDMNLKLLTDMINTPERIAGILQIKAADPRYQRIRKQWKKYQAVDMTWEQFQAIKAILLEKMRASDPADQLQQYGDKYGNGLVKLLAEIDQLPGEYEKLRGIHIGHLTTLIRTRENVAGLLGITAPDAAYAQIRQWNMPQVNVTWGVFHNLRSMLLEKLASGQLHLYGDPDGRGLIRLWKEIRSNPDPRFKNLRTVNWGHLTDLILNREKIMAFLSITSVSPEYAQVKNWKVPKVNLTAAQFDALWRILQQKAGQGTLLQYGQPDGSGLVKFLAEINQAERGPYQELKGVHVGSLTMFLNAGERVGGMLELPKESELYQRLQQDWHMPEVYLSWQEFADVQSVLKEKITTLEQIQRYGAADSSGLDSLVQEIRTSAQPNYRRLVGVDIGALTSLINSPAKIAGILGLEKGGAKYQQLFAHWQLPVTKLTWTQYPALKKVLAEKTKTLASLQELGNPDGSGLIRLLDEINARNEAEYRALRGISPENLSAILQSQQRVAVLAGVADDQEKMAQLGEYWNPPYLQLTGEQLGELRMLLKVITRTPDSIRIYGAEDGSGLALLVDELARETCPYPALKGLHIGLLSRFINSALRVAAAAALSPADDRLPVIHQEWKMPFVDLNIQQYAAIRKIMAAKITGIQQILQYGAEDGSGLVTFLEEIKTNPAEEYKNLRGVNIEHLTLLLNAPVKVAGLLGIKADHPLHAQLMNHWHFPYIRLTWDQFQALLDILAEKNRQGTLLTYGQDEVEGLKRLVQELLTDTRQPYKALQGVPIDNLSLTLASGLRIAGFLRLNPNDPLYHALVRDWKIKSIKTTWQNFIATRLSGPTPGGNLLAQQGVKAAFGYTALALAVAKVVTALGLGDWQQSLVVIGGLFVFLGGRAFINLMAEILIKGHPLRAGPGLVSFHEARILFNRQVEPSWPLWRKGLAYLFGYPLLFLLTALGLLHESLHRFIRSETVVYGLEAVLTLSALAFLSPAWLAGIAVILSGIALALIGRDIYHSRLPGLAGRSKRQGGPPAEKQPGRRTWRRLLPALVIIGLMSLVFSLTRPRGPLAGHAYADEALMARAEMTTTAFSILENEADERLPTLTSGAAQWFQNLPFRTRVNLMKGFIYSYYQYWKFFTGAEKIKLYATDVQLQAIRELGLEDLIATYDIPWQRRVVRALDRLLTDEDIGNTTAVLQPYDWANYFCLKQNQGQTLEQVAEAMERHILSLEPTPAELEYLKKAMDKNITLQFETTVARELNAALARLGVSQPQYIRNQIAYIRALRAAFKRRYGREAALGISFEPMWLSFDPWHFTVDHRREELIGWIKSGQPIGWIRSQFSEDLRQAYAANRDLIMSIDVSNAAPWEVNLPEIFQRGHLLSPGGIIPNHELVEMAAADNPKILDHLSLEGSVHAPLLSTRLGWVTMWGTFVLLLLAGAEILLAVAALGRRLAAAGRRLLRSASLFLFLMRMIRTKAVKNFYSRRHEVQLVSGVENMLEALARGEVKQYIATGADAEKTRASLAGRLTVPGSSCPNLAAYFESIQNGSRKKTKRDIIREIAGSISGEGVVVVIGDGRNDMLAAQGIPNVVAVGMSTGGAQTDLRQYGARVVARDYTSWSFTGSTLRINGVNIENVKAVVWDVDGTILDSFLILRKFAGELIAELLGQKPGDVKYAEAMKLGADMMEQGNGLPFAEVVANLKDNLAKIAAHLGLTTGKQPKSPGRVDKPRGGLMPWLRAIFVRLGMKG